MSTLSSDDHLNPQNPVYYAPRRLREGSPRTSASFSDARSERSSPLSAEARLSAEEARSERLRRLASTTPAYDALLEGAVAKALRHPLDPEFVHEPSGFTSERDQRKTLLRVAGRFAAAIGAAAVVALFFVMMIPASQDNARQPNGSGSSIAGILDSVKAAFNPPRQSDDEARPAASEFETILASSRTEQPVVTHEQSETLLQQFLQWQQKPARAP